MLVFAGICQPANSSVDFGVDRNARGVEIPPRSILGLGESFPDFVLQDGRGRYFRLSQMRGNYVLINFWATWCPPCIDDLPSMDALNQRFRAKAFSMIAVSVDESWPEINAFLSRLSRSPSFLILHDPGKRLASSYGVEKFPESFLIDPEGRLIRHYVGALNWTEPGLFGELESLISTKTK